MTDLEKERIEIDSKHDLLAENEALIKERDNELQALLQLASEIENTKNGKFEMIHFFNDKFNNLVNIFNRINQNIVALGGNASQIQDDELTADTIESLTTKLDQQEEKLQALSIDILKLK
ncbi:MULTISPECIES: hypothetical protein [unclassified Enterococcus]|uniref:hypothetical protein n=1 Tax=unclassified Enterococcus TaxID=2608891 RepID=UPI001553672D|nr:MULTISPECIES: hypothetical protein [unclassified Enterococcus]MBS7576341.1 hypothetical protein [Enterococcus sp. MMGLQ5-2]MBS7583573.1 hypothetical protein [Enterococcus sp. MMGLQ5-1]NPD11435.1 hypothetical protein [Enterococcus sp. MMGLQ5-1]NPD36179.1 hypothetical protein [Enterococcus sp. MMGLQ5-2]